MKGYVNPRIPYIGKFADRDSKTYRTINLSCYSVVFRLLLQLERLFMKIVLIFVPLLYYFCNFETARASLFFCINATTFDSIFRSLFYPFSIKWLKLKNFWFGSFQQITVANFIASNLNTNEIDNFGII